MESSVTAKEQKVPKDIGPSSAFGTQSATAKRGVYFCKNPLLKKPLSWFLIMSFFSSAVSLPKDVCAKYLSDPSSGLHNEWPSDFSKESFAVSLCREPPHKRMTRKMMMPRKTRRRRCDDRS